MPIAAIRWRASHNRDVPLSESLTGSLCRSDERVNSAVHQQAQRIEATNGISTAGPRERVNDGAAQQFDELSHPAEYKLIPLSELSACARSGSSTPDKKHGNQVQSFFAFPLWESIS